MKVICGLFIGSLLAFNAYAGPHCELEVAKTKDMIGADNTVENEQAFLSSAAKALAACKAEAEDTKNLVDFIELGKQNCDDFSSQGMSDMYHGHCYLKVAEAARWIL